MKALGVDVGVTSGVVVAELTQGRAIRVLRSSTVAYPLIDEATKTMLRDCEAFGVEVIVVEYPIIYPYATTTEIIAKTKPDWVMLINRIAGRLGADIVDILPSTWKSSVVVKMNPFEVQDDAYWKKYKPSKHELDASRILTWYARYGMDETISDHTP